MQVNLHWSHGLAKNYFMTNQIPEMRDLNYLPLIIYLHNL